MKWLLTVLVLASACGGEQAPVEQVPMDDVVYTCAMHPEVHQDGPGLCPMCAMELTAVKKGGTTTELNLGAGIRQEMGLVVEPVKPTTLFRHLKAPGVVTVPPAEEVVVAPRVKGWITTLDVASEGEFVRKGQRLFRLYSPELVAAQESFLAAPAGSERRAAGRRLLGRLGLTSSQINALASSGRIEEQVSFYAPSGGVVTSMKVTEGQQISGQPLMILSDLSEVWVEAEVFERDAPWVEAGQPATVALTHQLAEEVETKVSFVYPTIDPARGTLKIRLAVANPTGALRPGSLATVDLGYRKAEDALVLPRQAVLATGDRQVVFRWLGDGNVVPQEVTIGLAGDRDLLQITAGLSAGDEVVMNGLFLLDAETQLQEAFGGVRAADEAEVWACPMHPEEQSDGPGRCSQCGMDYSLVEDSP